MHTDTQALLTALADASGRPRQQIKEEFQLLLQELKRLKIVVSCLKRLYCENIIDM